MAETDTIPAPSRATEQTRLDLVHIAADIPLDDFFRRVTELSAAALDVERAGIWLFAEDGATLRCVSLYQRSLDQHSSGALLTVADFPRYFASLDRRRSVPASRAPFAPWTEELNEVYLKPLGIQSLLDSAIMIEAEMVGVVCFEHIGPPREWTTESLDFASSASDRVAVRIKATEVRELKALLAERAEQLSERNRTESLGQFAASIAHDLRNYLTVFLGNGELIHTNSKLPNDVREQGRVIADTAGRVGEMVQELLDFASPAVRRPNVIDLHQFTLDSLPELRAAIGSNFQLRYVGSDRAGRVFIDSNRYLRMLFNLALNARDAMPKGGVIEMRLGPVKLSGDASFTGRFVMLEVVDTGIGMDEATRKRALEPYFSTKSRGTGLGLAIVQRIVTRAGGLMRIESDPGQGTTMRVFFPLIGPSLGGTNEFPLLPE